MAMTDLRIVARSMRARLFSTIVTIMSVAVATALMLNLLVMRDASRQAFARGTGNMHMVVAAGGQSPLACVLDAVFYARAPQKAMTWAQFQRLADPRDRRIEWALAVQQGDSFRGFPTMAVAPEFFEKFEPLLSQKFTLREGAWQKGPYDVVVGSLAARGTGIKVGDRIVITHGTSDAGHTHDEHPYTVAGVLQPTATAHDRAVFITLESTWEVHGGSAAAEKPITGVYLRCRDNRVVGQVFAELRAEPTLTAGLVQAEIKNLWEIVGGIDRIVVAIAAAVLVSSGIGILLALYNSMEQRRRQIAVLRVLGASQGRVFSLVMAESALIGLLGAVAGAVLGYLATFAVAAVLRDHYNLVVDTDLAQVGRLGLILAAATVVLACAAGLLPALRAYGTPVASSLRPLN